MGNAGDISAPTPLCNFTTFNIKQETKKKKKTTTPAKTKLVVKQRWPFFRVVRFEDNDHSPLECNVGGVAEKASDYGEGKCEEDDGGNSWVAFDEEEEEEEKEMIFRPAAPSADAELEFASFYDDARSSFRPSSGRCGDIAFKIDEDGGLVREDANAAAAAVPEFDIADRQSAPPPNSSLKLIKRSSAAVGPLASFVAKTARSVGHPQRVVSTLLWLSFKRRALAVAAAQVRSKAGRVNVRVRKAVGGRIGFAGAGGAATAVKAEEELWERRIVMGRRCRARRHDDSPYGDDDDGPEVKEP